MFFGMQCAPQHPAKRRKENGVKTKPNTAENKMQVSEKNAMQMQMRASEMRKEDDASQSCYVCVVQNIQCFTRKKKTR